MKLCIENEEIMIGEENISFGDNYAKVSEQLKDDVYVKEEPRFIILKDVCFCGFKSKCTIFFNKEGLLKKIELDLDVSLYNLNKGDWKDIVEAINKVAALNRAELEKLYKKTRTLRAGRTQEFETNNILIISEISRDNDAYTIAIQKK
jgi:hypothetical protein